MIQVEYLLEQLGPCGCAAKGNRKNERRFQAQHQVEASS